MVRDSKTSGTARSAASRSGPLTNMQGLTSIATPVNQFHLYSPSALSMRLILTQAVELRRLAYLRNTHPSPGVNSDMPLRCTAGFLIFFALCACRQAPQPSSSQEAARLRSSFATHRAAYLASIEAENALVPATLRWLDGPAATQPRSLLRSTACRFTERWARVYFGPRHMQEQMRSETYAHGPLQDAHRRLMERLRQRYFLLHEYQRYSQRACEAPPLAYNAPGLPPGLLEFRNRLRVHPQAVDEITPVLASLPR